MTGVHRNHDSRACGAQTVVTGNTSVFVNGRLVSVDGDPNTHDEGALIADCNHFFCHSTLVVDNFDNASADALCPATPVHCNPQAVTASDNVFVGV